jgi:hypothetical protein
MNTSELDQERREECRADCLAMLATRQQTAHHPRAVRRVLNAGHVADYTEEEINAALAFLVSAALAQEVVEPMGATKYYQATSAGVIAHERRS